MTYEIEYDYDRGLFKIILSEQYTNPNHQKQFADILARIVKTINPMHTGVELAEHIKKFAPRTREERVNKALNNEDTKLLKQLFPDSTLIDVVYLSVHTHLIFKYLLPEDAMFLFEFGLDDYDILIKRREHYKTRFKEQQEMGELFEVILERK